MTSHLSHKGLRFTVTLEYSKQFTSNTAEGAYQTGLTLSGVNDSVTGVDAVTNTDHELRLVMHTLPD